MNQSPLAVLLMLAVFSGLSMNLILQCGLGMRSAAGAAASADEQRNYLPARMGLMFLTVLILWLIFSLFLVSFSWGGFEYIVLFPAASLVYSSLEYLASRFVLQRRIGGRGVGGIFAGAALFITLNTAGNFIEAAALLLGFAAGILLANAIISEIRRRATMEAIPRFLRGSPIALVSMGLLSLIFGSAALMFFRALGG
jgi:electron transport complex protein RnfA